MATLLRQRRLALGGGGRTARRVNVDRDRRGAAPSLERCAQAGEPVERALRHEGDARRHVALRRREPALHRRVGQRRHPAEEAVLRLGLAPSPLPLDRQPRAAVACSSGGGGGGGAWSVAVGWGGGGEARRGGGTGAAARCAGVVRRLVPAPQVGASSIRRDVEHDDALRTRGQLQPHAISLKDDALEQRVEGAALEELPRAVPRVAQLVAQLRREEVRRHLPPRVPVEGHLRIDADPHVVLERARGRVAVCPPPDARVSEPHRPPVQQSDLRALHVR
mmetsp:Transcript_45289/g.145723  ORF Transcript_45289/g.145723 Transcript_45289/m.145723 type:complete len:278 (-) Transcript_45289:569-1402(-)